ncbi:39S ribosomal protein L4, mitochondrial [Eumeta japonica]|uniref:Large ribosomal subunit protein uL4m n=1 Tax=Eumeta variegata TaxID=151549 RepID=A0A4C1U3N3_EUMVA|nr:39S ribosomal protein L4, mitochondrial [Eumeta japonica]
MTSILINALKRLHITIAPQIRLSSSSVPAVAHNYNLNVEKKDWKFQPQYMKPREVWIENMDTIDEKKMGLIELHPDVFAASPRIDIIHRNMIWQSKYRWVSWAHTKTRAEVRGGGRKPHPQKGQGRARHGSIRSPLYRGGGVIHGPRSGTTHFFMLPFHVRVHGLSSMISIKLAQDDLHVVNNLELPTDESQYLEDLIEKRNWGPSVLFVDE